MDTDWHLYSLVTIIVLCIPSSHHSNSGFLFPILFSATSATQRGLFGEQGMLKVSDHFMKGT